MQRWKAVIYNVVFALNCLLVFLVFFEERLLLPPWLQLLGRMHPLLVHFPIVLLLIAVVWELLPGRRTHPANDVIGDTLLLVAALTAVLSALMGLLLSKESGYSPESLSWHKWGGVGVSLLTLGWYGFRADIRRFRVLAGVTAIASVIGIVITGHLGANITHGEDFIYAPVLSAESQSPVLLEDAVVFTHMVQPIFKAKCAGCHNEKKAKGELVMSTPELLLKGGKTGPLWDPAEPDYGLLLRRVHLPMEAKKHMPPAGKPQLTETEIIILSKWIRQGATFDTRVAELTAGDTLKSMAATMFSTIETAAYDFEPAPEEKISKLHNNYRTVVPVSLGSPALGVAFFGVAHYKPEQLKELLAIKEQIVHLNLNKMPVTDNDLSVIAQFTNLRKLNLSFTNINGSNLAVLKSLKELKSLTLSGTRVKASGLTALSGLPNLSEVNIWSTPAQHENLAGLRNLLKRTVIGTGFVGDTIQLKLNQPLVENEEQVVVEPVPLKLKHFLKNVSIHYTIDGSEPDSIKSPLFNNDVRIDKSMTVKARAFKAGWISSDVAEKTFFKAGYKIDSIQLLQPPDPKYRSTGAMILSDNQKGDFNFGNGKWLGYRQTPLEAMLYFNDTQTISSVTISSLVDINSYLMPPASIQVWGGSDPAKLHLIKKLAPQQPTKEGAPFIKGYELAFKPEEIRLIKIIVVPVSKLPVWHRGRGDKGWVFVDEVFVN